jgi:hypothetical protein
VFRSQLALPNSQSGERPLSAAPLFAKIGRLLFAIVSRWAVSLSNSLIAASVSHFAAVNSFERPE